MTVAEQVNQCIEELMPFPIELTQNTHLYLDAHFDSLSFAQLIIDLEQAFSVDFSIDEMESCLYVGKLTETVRRKLKEQNTI